MIKMQDMILNELSEIATNFDLTPVVAYGASNTGTLHIMNKFHNVLMINFSFQPVYCSMYVNDENNKNLVDISNGYLEYKNSQELQKLIVHIDCYCQDYYVEVLGGGMED